LVHISPIPDTTPAEIKDEKKKTAPPTIPGPSLQTGALLGLKVVGSDSVVSLLGRVNYTLGRAIEDQAVIPDIDLSLYGAEEHGVSRIHAEVLLKPDGIYIIDLDSANGTKVNGTPIETITPVHLRHGDIIQLGGLSVQLISRFHR
jgi:pSer/pThr/pTyr-binding forkhead associated (FHA) protein